MTTITGLYAPRKKQSTLPSSAVRQLHAHWQEWSAISAFAAIVAMAIPFHEPWADEAQAWQLARSLPLRTLFQTNIRYEVTPGLWHFLLWILIRLHVTYIGLHWICGAIAVASTAVLVFRSPFPRYLKLLLPFTYFLVFQYAVVARSYVLVPLLLFAIACCWKKGPFRIAILLGVLANVALHAAVISGGLALIYCIQFYFVRAKASNLADRSNNRRAWLFFAAILIAFYAFALWTAWPPPNWLATRAAHPDGPTHPFAAKAAASILWGVCQPMLVSIPFWIAIAACLKARGRLYTLLPVLLFALFSGAVYFNWWHVGLVVPLLIVVLWISWPDAQVVSSSYEIAGRAALIYMIAGQLAWAGYAIAYDRQYAYSPDLAAATFLRPFAEEHASIVATYVGQPDAKAYDSVGLLPYFDRNILANEIQPFWWWDDDNPAEALFLQDLPSHPRVVLVEVRLKEPSEPIDLRDPKFRLLSNYGYKFTNEFCGSMPQGLKLSEIHCHLIFQ